MTATPTHRPVTAVTPEMRESAREIGEAFIRAQRDFERYGEAFRLACKRSREQHGDDLHEVVKGLALSGATGGRA